MSMSTVVAIIGEGLLADLVCEQLSDSCEVISQANLTAGVIQSAKLVVLICDHADSSSYLEAEDILQHADIPWLCGFIAYDTGVIGPLVRPGTPGCSQCADHRRMLAEDHSEEKLEWLVSRLMMSAGMVHSTDMSRIGLLHMAHLITAEAQIILQGGDAHTEGMMYWISLKTLKTSLHPFLPDPLCAVCGRLPEDSSAAARISLKPSPKVSLESYRCRPIDQLKGVLQREYLNNRTGLLNASMHDLTAPFASTVVTLPLFLVGNEVTGGRAHSYVESELTAILEGLERYCGLMPRGKRTVIRDSYRALADQAFNPIEVGVYSKEQYAQADFPYEPFDPDRTIDWVWGYSFLQERPILVPEPVAYYSLSSEDAYVHEGSNGCAVGSSMEEAIFHGIMEVVERDSFLITWYAKLPVPRLDPNSVSDPELRLMIERLQAITGYKVHLYNTTMENGIPSIWAMMKNARKQGMNLICAAGAHLDPVRAAKSAIHELAGLALTLNERFVAYGEACAHMFQDPFLVQQMADHSMLYGLPQAEERLQFLLDERRPLRSFNEQFKPRTVHPDLTDDLQDILDVFRQLKLEVIVVDQTSSELLRSGIYCVKVLIPGMLPITFGHHLVRLTGLERIYTVPVELGYSERPLTAEQLNPHPHPFP